MSESVKVHTESLLAFLYAEQGFKSGSKAQMQWMIVADELLLSSAKHFLRAVGNTPDLPIDVKDLISAWLKLSDRTEAIICTPQEWER